MKIQPAKRLLTLKIVYYGPGMSGKTTNLEVLHNSIAGQSRGSLVQLDTETERTLFFDYCPLVIGKIGGFRVKVDFFTVPGQSFYTSTRRAVLNGADGIVFVADSSERREDANLQSRQDMHDALAEEGIDLVGIPHVYQWNKRDVSDAMSPKQLSRLLNPEGAPEVEATATAGTGVMETHKAILKVVLEAVRAELGEA